jgi:hypothetical protein
LNQPQNDNLGTHNHRATSTVNETAHSHTQTTINDDFNNNGNYGNNYTTPSYAQYDSAGSITWNNTINSTKTNITVSTTTDLCGNSVETRPYNYGINWIIKYF